MFPFCIIKNNNNNKKDVEIIEIKKYLYSSLDEFWMGSSFQTMFVRQIYLIIDVNILLKTLLVLFKMFRLNYFTLIEGQ